MKLCDRIWYYIGNMVDNSNILPDEDMIYTEFERSFEVYGHNPDIIAETVQSYVGVSDLSGVDIRWEGELDGISRRRIESQLEIPHKTA